MKHFFIFLFASTTLLSCNQKPEAKNDIQPANNEMKTMSDSAKQLLIDISNNGWFQAQVAEVALGKLQDTAMLSLAQSINRQYTRIRAKAKIVSIPYKLNMPYFLRSDQNVRVNELKAMDKGMLGNAFLKQIAAVNDTLTGESNQFRILAKGDSAINSFLDFSTAIVDSTQAQVIKKIGK